MLFTRIKDEGFGAVEAVPPAFRGGALKKCLDKHGLVLIAQIHTTGSWVDENGYNYCTSNKLKDHMESFETLAREAKDEGAVLINSHSGHDSWALDDAITYFTAAIALERELDIPIAHETHRQRQLFSPYQAKAILSHPQMYDLKITADLSHWCCVCEHVFDPSDKRDDWWPEVLKLVADHTILVHARVGYDEGPQVSDPSAPEFRKEVSSHMTWWKAIWAAQRARGMDTCFVEPEFGPTPYQQTLPHTKQPTTDLWAINLYVAGLVQSEFAKMDGVKRLKSNV